MKFIIELNCDSTWFDQVDPSADVVNALKSIIWEVQRGILDQNYDAEIPLEDGEDEQYGVLKIIG